MSGAAPPAAFPAAPRAPNPMPRARTASAAFSDHRRTVGEYHMRQGPGKALLSPPRVLEGVERPASKDARDGAPPEEAGAASSHAGSAEEKEAVAEGRAGPTSASRARGARARCAGHLPRRPALPRVER